MNTARLLDLASKLEQVNPENFNIATFGNCHFQQATQRNEPLTVDSRACAIGYLALWYPKTWRFLNGTIWYFEPEGEQCSRWIAVQRFFDISLSAAMFLFEPEPQRSPTAVAEAIRQLVAASTDN